MEERINLRFCTFFVNDQVSHLLTEIYKNGLQLKYKNDDNSCSVISDLYKYANDTYKLTLEKLTDDEYYKYETHFNTVIQPQAVYGKTVVIYEDDEVIIFIG